MNTILDKLFSEYLSNQSIAAHFDYAALGRQAFEKEKQLRGKLDAEQTACFEELFELSAQIHFLEVKDAFYNGCKLGAAASRELVT